MRTCLVLAVSLFAVQGASAERRAAKPGAMAVRRAVPRASAMSLRRGSNPPPSNPAPAPSIPDPGPGAQVPAPPQLGPRITPPSGTTVPAHDLRKSPGVRYEAADPARPEKPAPMIRDEALAAFKGAVEAAAAASVPGAAPKARVLQAGSDGRAVGGASDPVVFLTGGAASGQTGTHNRDQGGKPADPSGHGNGKGD